MSTRVSIKRCPAISKAAVAETYSMTRRIPAGTVNIGNYARITPMNDVVPSIQELLELPIRTGAGPTVFLRDIGSIADSSDILAGYALANGKRAARSIHGHIMEGGAFIVTARVRE